MGHILRRDQQIPANQAMTYYFKQTNNTGFRGKPRTTLPTKLDEDLVNYFNKTEQLKDHGYSKILRLRNNTDLDELRDKAADRTEWQCLVEKLGETTGEVDDSDESTTEAEDYSADRESSASIHKKSFLLARNKYHDVIFIVTLSLYWALLLLRKEQ